jgi:hypothetical protein
MTLHRIEAILDCDGCGHRFSVELDGGYEPPKGWALYEVAEDACRAGTARGTIGMKGVTSVQGGLMLCPNCTRLIDEKTPDNPTTAEVRAALPHL